MTETSLEPRRGRFSPSGQAKRWRVAQVRWSKPLITFEVEVEREEDGRWLAEVVELPGVLAYGDSQETAISRAEALALRVITER